MTKSITCVFELLYQHKIYKWYLQPVSKQEVYLETLFCIFCVKKLGIDLIGEFVFKITQKVTVKSRSIRLSTDWKNLSLILMFQCRSFFEEERHACMILKYTESKSVRDSITLFLFSNNKYNVIKIYRYFCQNFLFYNFFSREREIGCWKRTAIEWHISY